jgi:hypothetical protein
MRTVLALVIALAASASAVVHAQPAVEAEQLFREGKALRAAKKYDEACTAFEGSQRLGPSVSTLMNLADCRELNGQLASSWALFLEVVSTARKDDKLKVLADKAKQRADALEPRLSHLIINVPDESRIEGLVITRNDVVIDAATWNRAMPVDGGTYKITGKAPDHEPWSTEVTVAAEKETRSVDVPRFKALSGNGEEPDPRPIETRPGERDGGGGGMSGKRKIALGLGGVALASLGVAVAFELSGRSTLDEYDNAPAGPDRDALYDDANGKHHLAQYLAIAGVGCAAAATFLWLTGGTSDRADATALVPTLGASFAGASLQGAW